MAEMALPHRSPRARNLVSLSRALSLEDGVNGTGLRTCCPVTSWLITCRLVSLSRNLLSGGVHGTAVRGGVRARGADCRCLSSRLRYRHRHWY